MDILQKMKKLPLMLGVLLIMIWGVNNKTIFQINHTSCIQHTAKPLPSYLDRLDKLTCLTNASWEQFYMTARPILPAIISDKELKFVYHFLQESNETHFDEPLTQKDRLRVLLIFSSVIN